MDAIHPWLDPIEVHRLADKLMRPEKPRSTSVSDAGFGENFVGFATDPEDKTPPPATVPTNITSGGIKTPISTQPTAQTSGRGPLWDRITCFQEWMRQNFSATDLFILDREGRVIFDEGCHGRLHFLARSLASASRRADASGGNVHVKISTSTTLEVIPVETAFGCLVLGAVVPDALSPASVQAVMEALSLVASPPPK